ncbi:MAG TPA: HAMP domain-containing sensor histidine kinase [Gaiellaceae bacterium]|nr:HAMP domain-containing sensor histidine kinase [Gaiellaceae bacterium]
MQRPIDPGQEGSPEQLELEAERGRALLEESTEIVLLLDDEGTLLGASRRARETLAGLEVGSPVPDELLRPEPWRPRSVPLELDGRRELLVYLREPGDLAAYEELRAGFTAAVSHELRTPLARLLALLETALLPSANAMELIEQGKAEVEQIRELIDDVLFLSELETGRAVVSLASTRAAPIVRDVLEAISEPAVRAGVMLGSELDEDAEVPLRPRMLRVVLENLAENAIRYAGDGASFSITLSREPGEAVIVASDNGVGASDEDLQRLFERFYRADRARASRGTGLGLAIVKHIVTSAGGSVAASGSPGQGLKIRIAFRA